MEPIFSNMADKAISTPDADLEHRRMLIQAGEELKRSPALQYYLQYQYHKQANDLLNLSVSSGDGDNQFDFMLAHNNVHARLKTLKSIWILGEHLDSLVAEYQVAVNHQQNEQE